MYSSNACCGEAPSYGGARHYGRHPRGYRALGLVQYPGLGQAAVTLTGRARYFTGKVETSRRFVQDGPCETCESYKTRFPRSVYTCAPKSSPEGWCAFYLDHTTRDLRPGFMGAAGDSGWGLSVPQLIPTAGGFLPGVARLQGAIPAGIRDGDQITLQGSWVGTPPNNLCVNCGWDFNVSGEAPAGAPPGDTGVLDPSDPAMIEARLEATAIHAEQEALDQGASPEDAAEAGEEARDAVEDGAEAPPITTAGMNAGTIATLALGAMLLFPMFTKKGRKAARTGGVKRWGV